MPSRTHPTSVTRSLADLLVSDIQLDVVLGNLPPHDFEGGKYGEGSRRSAVAVFTVRNREVHSYPALVYL